MVIEIHTPEFGLVGFIGVEKLLSFFFWLSVHLVRSSIPDQQKTITGLFRPASG